MKVDILFREVKGIFNKNLWEILVVNVLKTFIILLLILEDNKIGDRVDLVFRDLVLINF